MKHYEFTITLSGYGTSLQKAWNDASEAFSLDPGPIPEDDQYELVYDEEEDE